LQLRKETKTGDISGIGPAAKAGARMDISCEGPGLVNPKEGKTFMPAVDYGMIVFIYARGFSPDVSLLTEQHHGRQPTHMGG
jgi:hypothetical protein